MALTSRDQLISANSASFYFQKSLSTSTGSYVRGLSSWNAAGFMPAAAPTPAATAASCDASTPGALPLLTPAAGKSLYLTSFNLFQSQVAVATSHMNVTLLDRAAHIGGILPAAAAAEQPVNLSLPARVAGTHGYRAYIEAFTATANYNGTLSISYTNSDGVAGRTATLVNTIGYTGTGASFPFPLQGRDRGISSVQSVTQTSGTSATGELGVVLARPLLNVAASNQLVFARRNFMQLTDVGAAPCLYLHTLVGISTIPVLTGQYTVVEG